MECGSSSTAVQAIKIEPYKSHRNSRHNPNKHATEDNRSISSGTPALGFRHRRRSSILSSSDSKKSTGSYSQRDNQETNTPETTNVNNDFDTNGLQNKDLGKQILDYNNKQDNIYPVNLEQEEPKQRVMIGKTENNQIKTEIDILGEEQRKSESFTEDRHDQNTEENAHLSRADNKTKAGEGDIIVHEQSYKIEKETVELKEQNPSNRIIPKQKPQPNPFGPENELLEDRWTKHERIAVEKEEKRQKYDFDLREQTLLTKFTPIDMPAIDEVPEHTVQAYTTLDIQAHNMDNPCDWFKFGRKIYSNYKFWPIVKGRAEEYNKVFNDNTVALTTESVLNPVLTARELGVSRKIVRQLLPKCLVGIFVDVHQDEYLSSMKEDVEGILEDLNDGEDMGESEFVQEYKQQLLRWLIYYPNTQLGNRLQDYNMDPNEITFPLPSEILYAPNVLRQWVETFEPFDIEVPEEGAWRTMQPDVLFDTNKYDSKTEPEEQLEDFDMTLDGEAAWNSIDIDLFKIDETTNEQDRIWKLREKRTNLADTNWMASRREALGGSLTIRHEWEPHIVVPYLKCCDNLEESWKKFQELCKKEFVSRHVEIVVNNTNDGQNTANVNVMRPDENESQMNQLNPPELETKDSGLDLSSTEPLELESDNSPRDKER